MTPAFSAGRFAMSVGFLVIGGGGVLGGLDGILPEVGIFDIFFMAEISLELG